MENFFDVLMKSLIIGSKNCECFKEFWLNILIEIYHFLVPRYTYNETARIPVLTPVYEDTILVKLWTYNMFSPDELLAQGFISFSELRNAPLKPTWFNFYGWNRDEVGDIDAITKLGESLEPNYFLGRILISGRVDRLDSPEDMQPARMVNCRTAEEPVQVCN